MSRTRHVRIAIADDHQIFRDGLRRLLETEPGFEVVAEAIDALTRRASCATCTLT